MVVSADLGVAKQELKRVKDELATFVEAETLALKQAKYAKLAAEMDSIKLDELTKEIASANELFDLAKLAYEEAQRETTAIIAEEQAEAQKLAATREQTSKQLEASRKELAAAEDLQSKASLIATTAETNNLLVDQISNPRHHLPFYTAIDSLNNFNFNFNFNFNSAPHLRETP